MAPSPDDGAPALGNPAGGEGLAPALARPSAHDALAPELGTPAGGGRGGGRAWWRSLKGPIAVLLRDLEAQNPLVRRRAAEALVRLGDRRAVSALAHALRDPAPDVRMACARALGRMGDAAARGALRPLMRDARPAVRVAAAEALAALHDVEALPLVEALVAHFEAFGTPHEAARVAAIAARLRGEPGG